MISLTCIKSERTSLCTVSTSVFMLCNSLWSLVRSFPNSNRSTLISRFNCSISCWTCSATSALDKDDLFCTKSHSRTCGGHSHPAVTRPSMIHEGMITRTAKMRNATYSQNSSVPGLMSISAKRFVSKRDMIAVHHFRNVSCPSSTSPPPAPPPPAPSPPTLFSPGMSPGDIATPGPLGVSCTACGASGAPPASDDPDLPPIPRITTSLMKSEMVSISATKSNRFDQKTMAARSFRMTPKESVTIAMRTLERRMTTRKAYRMYRTWAIVEVE
mmetsp:Transcript_59215/g.175991  ORF Transcript_59215/g.175991 Transcript_59215/m.175991 type:complete len:272 (+) Transcript_59215:386-1201(+)